MKNKRGFTIIELSLAMAFISVLLVTIAYLTINITSIYQKGLALRAVTSTGRQLVEDFKSTIAKTTAASLYCDQFTGAAKSNCEGEQGRSFVYQQHYKDVTMNDGTVVNVPVNGIFCTDRYTYIWNTGYALNYDDYSRPSGTVAGNITLNNKAIPATTFGNGYVATFNGQAYKLLKLANYSSDLCGQYFDEAHYTVQEAEVYAYSSPHPDDYQPEEMLTANEDELALYDLNFYPPAIHDLTTQAFYSGTFILGTLRGSININGNGDYCKDTPDTLVTDFAYCSINKFNFAVRAMGKSS